MFVWMMVVLKIPIAALLSDRSGAAAGNGPAQEKARPAA